MMRTISSNLYLFWQGTVLSYVAMFYWLRSPGVYLASKVFGPLAQLFFFVFLGTFASGPDKAQFFVVGNALQIAAVSGIYGVTMSVGGDREEGTLPYLFGTPANRFVIFFGRAFMHILDGALGVVIAFMWGVLLMGLDLSHTDVFGLGLTIVITTLSTCGLGLLMGCLSLITVNVMFVNNFVYFVLLIFSGANLDLKAVPAWIGFVSEYLPLTHGIAAARALVAGDGLADVSPLLFTELGIGLLYGLLGYLLFFWFETQARRRGTLETV